MAALRPRLDSRKLIREFAMLVIGVMVALSADSWWQDHQAKSDVDSLLLVLRSELEGNRESLVQSLARRAQLVEQNQALVRLVNEGHPFPSSDVLIPLVYSPLEGRPPDLSFGAYEVLLSRGTTEFVDADLLARLASHVSLARSGQAWDDHVRQDVIGTINEVIGRNGGFLSTASDSFRSSRGLPLPAQELDVDGLMGDLAFQNAATIGVILHYNWQGWLEARLGETEGLIADLM